MAKISKELREVIAESFDIKKYDDCNELDLIGWAEILSFRYVARHCHHVSGADGSPFRTDLTLQIFVNPLPKTNWNKPLMGGGYKVVQDLQIVDLIHGKEEVLNIPGMEKVVKEYEKRLAEDNYELAPEGVFSSYHSQCLEHGIYKGSRNIAKVLVDLSAADQQLISEFAKWLTNKRAEITAQGDINNYAAEKITAKSMKDWCDSRVLAFIDLSMVAEWVNCEIPYHVMGDLLFPDDIDVDVGERVRKKIKPLAEKLQDPKFLSVLQMAANKVYQSKAE